MSKDNWETPQWLFNELNREFKFNIDLCATADNTKCKAYCKDYLKAQKEELKGKELLIGFMNPPYSNPLPFLERAISDIHLGIFRTIVMLLPAKTDTKWFRLFVNPYWGRELSQTNTYKTEIRYFPYLPHHPSRIAFVNPDTGKEQKGNPCGSMLVILTRSYK